MKRQKQGSLKISIFTVQIMAKQQAKIGKQRHAKWGPREGNETSGIRKAQTEKFPSTT